MLVHVYANFAQIIQSELIIKKLTHYAALLPQMEKFDHAGKPVRVQNTKEHWQKRSNAHVISHFFHLQAKF
jgi:hypothetical protein